MDKVLIIVDMQKDFVDGALGTQEARAIVDAVRKKLAAHEGPVIFTQDTHQPDYLNTQEGRLLPVEHCIEGTEGWRIIPELRPYAEKPGVKIIRKPTFASVELARALAARAGEIEEIELVGLCTDICVVSNALLLKAFLPEMKISVDSACCAGVTPEKHAAALETLRSCQIDVH